MLSIHIMDNKVLLIILGIIFLAIFLQKKQVAQIPQDIPTHISPKHVLYDVLKKFSNGDKITLTGTCKSMIYTKYTITSEMKQYFKEVINDMLLSIYNITNSIYQVQELNNIYEEIDSKNNKRYIVDATLNAIQNFYTVNLILDFVIINGDTYINYINVNTASNNNILDKYDVKYKGTQGILFHYNNFDKNIKTLLDTEYKKQSRLIGVSDSSLNYDFNNVLSLSNLMNMYVPSTLSTSTLQDYENKNMKGLVEQYFPPDLTIKQSTLFCDKDSSTWNKYGIYDQGNQNCVFENSNVSKEIRQPLEYPGLFYNRSSFRK